MFVNIFNKKVAAKKIITLLSKYTPDYFGPLVIVHSLSFLPWLVKSLVDGPCQKVPNEYNNRDECQQEVCHAQKSFYPSQSDHV